MRYFDENDGGGLVIFTSLPLEACLVMMFTSSSTVLAIIFRKSFYNANVCSR